MIRTPGADVERIQTPNVRDDDEHEARLRPQRLDRQLPVALQHVTGRIAEPDGRDVVGNRLGDERGLQIPADDLGRCPPCHRQLFLERGGEGRGRRRQEVTP